MKSITKPALSLALCLTVAFSAACIGGGNSGDSSSGGGTTNSFDTRNLTAQEYSIANLTAVDDYGRMITVKDPTDSDKKYLGMFYFAWLGSHGSGMSGIYDVTKLQRDNPDALYDPTNTTDSPAWQFHFESEPLYGYYSMRDEWVINRHVELFTMAGLDYLLFDFTNAVVYDDIAELVLNVLKKYQDQGWKVPKVGFYTNSSSATVVKTVYDRFYASGLWDSLWFKFAGDSRPVIVGISDKNGGATDQTDSAAVVSSSSELYNYFNFYESQWPSSGKRNEEKGFPWMQWGSPYPHTNGFMSVSVAQHSAASVFFSDQRMNSSRGFTGGLTVEEDWKKGANFEWQWRAALDYSNKGKVSNIFVTGWNEWTAIKYPSANYHTDANRWLGIPYGPSGYTGKEVWFVDDFNAEYSREVEPGKEYGDGFYMQLVRNARDYKYKPAQKYKMKTRTFSDLSDFSAWRNVFVEYADFAGDAMKRDAENAANVAHSYIDESNRNDIKLMKVAHDNDKLYVYVETVDDITEYNGTDKNWMNLFLSVGNTEKSFAGFNYIVNRTPKGKTTSIERSTGGFNWETVGNAEFAVGGNKMVFAIPLSVLGITDADDVSLSFKVTDNVQKQDDILDYYVTGDSAPIGRFGYAYGKN